MRRLVFVSVVASLVIMMSLSSIAEATATITKQERIALRRAMVRYRRLLTSTTVDQAVAQMRAEESEIAPCVGQLKSFYDSHNPNSGVIDWILGAGVHDTGEPWYARAAVPIYQAFGSPRLLADINLTTNVHVCPLLERWSAEGYDQADRPKVYTLLSDYVSPSPLAIVGTRFQVKTFMGWGYPRRTAGQLVDDLSTALARYSMLNEAVGKQFIGWLQQKGIYQVMQPVDRDTMNFTRY